MRRFPTAIIIISIGLILIAHDFYGFTPPGQGNCLFSEQLKDPAFRDDYEKQLAGLQLNITENYDFASNTLDPVSAACLACHDGSIAPAVHNRLRSLDNIGYPGGGNHPIGMNYAGSARRKYFVPLGAVSKYIVMIGGKIGCLSCHNPQNAERNHLSINNDRSGLCLSCHIR